MSIVLKGATAEIVQVLLARTLLDSGEYVSPRGLTTFELQNVMLVLEDPTRCYPHGIRDKMNINVGIVEALQLIGGFSDPERTVDFVPNMKQFQNNGVFDGAYGARTQGQLQRIVDILRKDWASRQAVLTIRDPYRDLMPGSNDIPCTIAASFRIRNGKLFMTTHMRSNDIVWGLPYDMFQFSMLQLTLAKVLNVGLGTYTHIADSLHMYDHHIADVERIARSTPSITDAKRFDGLEDVGQRAIDIFYGKDVVAPNDTEKLFIERMSKK